ncbi:hypothetical protein SDRG_11530 [Saprolegnia diclina VS20]|uniref:PDEase domain-containing protein n=1 Tax=Saprolegnia diclina (strain VS20) TaxID=1156394 RepID=T0PYY6_SAPDV|nr:hypothetical protein SDRG_11530 [Saprolegnia diclina VS20]EQC30769.1 hypothetical protein SDRG_11530 [Saprolegnia diclina VS20]|eukprot:XP_008615793.1 hypothetical protein SDRG_11530 [Saprolegnia diclina VS20]
MLHVEAAHSWTLNVFALSTAEMISLATRLLHWAGVDAYLGLSTPELHAFVVRVEAEYRDVAFHNFRHGVCVMHVTYLVLHGLGMHTVRDDVAMDVHHRSALLLAALCHDAQHDGRTNQFHVATKSATYVRFPVRAPLEHLHAATTLHLLDDTRLLAKLSMAEAQTLRTRIVDLIMATDMNLHDEVLANAKAEPTDIDAVAKLILHCADISNPIMTTDMSRRWAKCLMDEFAAQVADERGLGLPVSTFMIAAPNSRDEARLHMGFIERYSGDAWHTLVDVLNTSPDLFATCLSNLAANETYWRLRIDKWTPSPARSVGHKSPNESTPVVRPPCVESLQAA